MTSNPLLPAVVEKNRVYALAHPFSMKGVDSFAPCGLTIEEVLSTDSLLVTRCSSLIVIVDDRVIPRAIWHCYVPHPGALIIIRAIPSGGGGGGVLRTVLMIAVVAAAAAAAPGLVGLLGTVPTFMGMGVAATTISARRNSG